MAIDIQSLQALLKEAKALNRSVSITTNVRFLLGCFFIMYGPNFDRVLASMVLFNWALRAGKIDAETYYNDMFLNWLDTKIKSLTPENLDQNTAQRLAHQINIVYTPIKERAEVASAVCAITGVAGLYLAYQSRDAIVRAVMTRPVAFS